MLRENIDINSIPNKYFDIVYHEDGKIKMLTTDGLIVISYIVYLIWKEINGINSINDIVEKIKSNEVVKNLDELSIEENVKKVIIYFIEKNMITVNWKNFKLT